MSIPVLPATAWPEPVPVTVCGLCRGDWDAHLGVASERWDVEHRDEVFAPGSTLPEIVVIPHDCVVVLRRAAQGPPGPIGMQGAMGLRGEPGAQGERGPAGSDS